MTRKALERNRLANEFYTVSDGEELLDFLHHRGAYAPPALSPTPGLILLDLNMPRMDGREALAAIKADPDLRRIPVVVMTTSQAEQDITRSYDLGTNSFISKPITLAGLIEVTKVLGHYWFQIVRLPEPPAKG
ncbi:MAG: response regulator [Deltaproteobacteria bacterium]|nr:response regulator [Deltaproteobacteria bacterium]MDQ3295473.1 response regulator [Myxococcota bacterium]